MRTGERSSAGGREGSGTAAASLRLQVPDRLFGEGRCTGRLTQQVHENRVAQQQRETHERPGQEWCMEGEEAKEVDPHLGVAAAPHVHQHDCEGLAQEEQAAQEPQQLSQSQGVCVWGAFPGAGLRAPAPDPWNPPSSPLCATPRSRCALPIEATLWPSGST